MKIKSIRISNILSFAYYENFEEAPEIIFHHRGGEGSLHILIGANGSGKSNLVEVLNQIFKKALFRQFVFNDIPLKNYEKNPAAVQQLREVLTHSNILEPLNLEKNRYAESDVQKICVILELNDNDFANIEFLNQNRDAIEDLRMKYSQNFPTTDKADIEVVRTFREILIELDKNKDMPAFSLSFAPDNPPLIANYLTYFEGYQSLIVIYNDYVRADKAEKWRPLKRTFALLGSYRNYNALSSSLTIDANRTERQKNIHNKIRGETTRGSDGGEPAVFELVKTNLAYRYFQNFYPALGQKGIAGLKEEEPFISINRLIKNYLRLNLGIEHPDPLQFRLDLYLEDEQGKRVETHQLSSGEKGILHFIFTLYGYDLQNAVMLIDEPELHLHPQMQKRYLDVIEEVKKRFDLQFIIATHSALFVDKETINDVYRFYMDEGGTRVINPVIEASQKSLAKILDYTNSSKIFFVDKVILVEGETDEYFYAFYFDWLKKISGNEKESGFEILNIKGKGERELWTDFLRKFGLNVFFIGDWDNITELGGFDLKLFEEEYHRTQMKASKEVTKKGSQDGRTLFDIIDRVIADPSPENLDDLKGVREYIIHRLTDYAALIRFIKDRYSGQWDALQSKIEAKYSEGIFILKQGELEDYIGTEKGLAGTILFCQNYFETWQGDPAFALYRAELECIFKKIFPETAQSQEADTQIMHS